jgi:oligopeptide/dipeptide ABC transporter ATP-binding protein
MTADLLRVEDLRLSFRLEEGGTVRALHGVSFSVAPGETLALAGESGCGKSVTALSILRLLAVPPAVPEGGRILFKGRDLLALPPEEMRAVRGREISMVFQEPMTSLNPVLTVGEQVAEVFTAHGACGKAEAMDRAVEWLRRVRIPDPEARARQYPHQLSGGLRQRAMIAAALALRPSLLIADEPTTALDVTIQAQVLDLVRELKEETGMAVLLITHDLGVVRESAQRCAVMYLGRIVETAPSKRLLDAPLHPYTEGLVGSLPGTGKERLSPVAGAVPPLSAVPPGCPFADRCPLRRRAKESHPGERDPLSACDVVMPPLEEYEAGHFAACHFRALERAGRAPW